MQARMHKILRDPAVRVRKHLNFQRPTSKVEAKEIARILSLAGSGLNSATSPTEAGHAASA
jgi:hypothetical protein